MPTHPPKEGRMEQNTMYLGIYPRGMSNKKGGWNPRYINFYEIQMWLQQGKAYMFRMYRMILLSFQPIIFQEQLLKA